MNQYPDHWLESPPPPSRFRRPWSPDPYDPLPTASNTRTSDRDPYHSVGQWAVERRHEPSDVSVEALDLADYARTLNRNNHFDDHNAQQPSFRPYDPYPPSPRSNRPLARTDSLNPPSLTSASSSQSYRSPMRRPFSLPPPSSYPGNSRGTYSSQASRARHDQHIVNPESEIDIAQFPSFSRGWYTRDHANHFSPPNSSHGHGGDDAPKRNPFDPSYTLYRDPFMEPYNPSPPPSYPYGSSYGHQSRYSHDHNLVPWSADPDGGPVDHEIKEERMRMLEREFGKNAKNAEEPEQTVGSVDPRGMLITDGPKKRLAVRCIQVFLALTAAISSIYSGLVCFDSR